MGCLAHFVCLFPFFFHNHCVARWSVVTLATQLFPSPICNHLHLPPAYLVRTTRTFNNILFHKYCIRSQLDWSENQ